MKTNNALIEQAYDTIYDYLMNRSDAADAYKKALARNTVDRYNNRADAALLPLLFDLRDAIQQNGAKNSGNGNLRKAMEKIIKDADESRPIFKGAYYDAENECTVVTDAFSLICTKESVELPPAHLDEGQKWVDYKRIVPSSDCMREVKLPTVAELKTYIKLNKNNERVLVPNDRNKPMVAYLLLNEDGELISMYDAKRLLSVIDGLGDDAKAYVDWKKPSINPILIETETTKALVCPIRIYNSNDMERRGLKYETRYSAAWE